MDIYKNKDILVTGGCGSIGSEIVKQLLKHNPKRVRVLDNSEVGHFNLKRKIKSKHVRYLIGDVRNKERVMRACEGVDIVFHASALKHVDLCEYNPFEAVQTNVIGTQNLIEAAIDKGVKKFIGISTDKATAPVNTMGATKLLAEKITINAPVGTSKSKFACVRFGNVLNSAGSVIPIFKSQIEKGGPVTITNGRMTRFFMTIPEAVKMILKVPSVMKGGEIFVLNNMKALRIFDLAEAMIKESKKDIKITIIGIKPGEKLHELLVTEQEIPYVSIKKNMFVVSNPIWHKPNTQTDIDIPKDSNDVKWLTQDEIRKLLKKEGLLWDA